MLSRQTIIGFAVGLTSVAFCTIMVFSILVIYDRRKKALLSRASTSVGERYRPEGSYDGNYSPRDEYGRDISAFEPVERPLQHREPNPFATLSHSQVTMDQSSLTGTGTHFYSIGRPTLAFGPPTRLENGRVVNYSEGRVNNGYIGDWEHNRPRRSVRYHSRGMRIDIPRNNFLQPHSQSNETRSVEGYLNNALGNSRSFDSGYSESVLRPQPLGGDYNASLDESGRSSSQSSSSIPAFLSRNHDDYPVRLHRQELTTHDEQHEHDDSYF